MRIGEDFALIPAIRLLLLFYQIDLEERVIANARFQALSLETCIGRKVLIEKQKLADLGD
jgi:hypothetical protein